MLQSRIYLSDETAHYSFLLEGGNKMKINLRQQLSITVLTLIVSIAMVESLSVKVRSSSRNQSPDAATLQRKQKRAALSAARRNAALNRLRASRWANHRENDIDGLDELDVPEVSAEGQTLHLANPPVRDEHETKVTVRDAGPELGASFSAVGFVFNRANPSHMILPTDGRIFRSSNGGHNWSPVNLLTDRGFYDGAFFVRQDPANSNILFALTLTTSSVSQPSLFRSQDFGDTWTRVNAGFSSPTDCAIHEEFSNRVFVLNKFPDLDAALWKSEDGGTTFEPHLGSGLPTAIFDDEIEDYLAFPIYTNIATTPADPNVLYVVFNSDDLDYYTPSIYKSVDGGETFAPLDASPPRPLQVFPHPTQANVLFVQDDSFPSSTDIYRSTDGGITFEPVTGRLPDGQLNFFVAFDIHNPSFVYIAGEGGLFHSTDGGNTFRPLGLREDQIGLGATTASIDPSNSRVIYVNTSLGNFKSFNGGTSFISINNGWKVAFANDITFDNAPEPNLYAAVPLGIGIVKTKNRGNQYEQLTLPAGPGSSVNGFPWPNRVTVSPTNQNMILVTTRGEGVFYTFDGGKTWTASDIETGQTSFLRDAEIAIDPVNPNLVHLVSGNDPFPGFYRSSNGGQSFQRTLFVPSSSARSRLNDLAIDPQNPNVIYAGSRTFFTNSVLRKSTDGGLSFADIPIGRSAVTDIVVDPINSNNVYLAGSFRLNSPTAAPDFLVRSTDAGATFVAADAGLSNLIIGVVIDPVNPSRLFAWTLDGLFISNDRGGSWTLLEGEETKKAALFGSAIAINPKRPRFIYLAGSTVLEVKIH